MLEIIELKSRISLFSAYSGWHVHSYNKILILVVILFLVGSLESEHLG